MRKPLVVIFVLVLGFAVAYKSPFSAVYNLNKGSEYYHNKQYEKAISCLERSLFASPNNSAAQKLYALSLANTNPTYTVQKKLYKLYKKSNSTEVVKLSETLLKSMKFKLSEGLEYNYIGNAVLGNDIIRWDINSFPLKVYYENIDSVPSYYVENIEKALKLWTDRTNFVKFEKVSDEGSADIVIKFSEIPSDVCADGVCKYAVANTLPIISNNVLKRMVLTFYKTNPFHKKFSSREIFNTALHEIGHTLGIMGHSENIGDLMYSAQNNAQLNDIFRQESSDLTMRDLRTLVLLYRLEPTISDKKSLRSENFYYAPIFLGDDDARLQRKAVEFEQYIANYPNMSAGYINLATVKAELGDFDSAEKLLNQAQVRAKTADEKGMILYNKAVISFNRQDYNLALTYAEQAYQYKQDLAIKELLSEINSLIER